MLAAIDMLADVRLRMKACAITRALESLVAISRDGAVRVGESFAAHMARRHAAWMTGAGSNAAAIPASITATVREYRR
jgi:hypothetical protein